MTFCWKSLAPNCCLSNSSKPGLLPPTTSLSASAIRAWSTSELATETEVPPSPTWELIPFSSSALVIAPVSAGSTPEASFE